MLTLVFVSDDDFSAYEFWLKSAFVLSFMRGFVLAFENLPKPVRERMMERIDTIVKPCVTVVSDKCFGKKKRMTHEEESQEQEMPQFHNESFSRENPMKTSGSDLPG